MKQKHVRWGFAGASVLVGVAFVISCVGDSSTTTAIPGSDAGAAGAANEACYPNFTCNPGLTCSPSNVCTLTDGGASGSTDSGNANGTDGSSTGSSDAGAVDASFDGSRTVCSSLPVVVSSCIEAGLGDCIAGGGDSNGCVPAGSTCSSPPTFFCGTNADCTGGGFCCGRATFTIDSSCSVNIADPIGSSCYASAADCMDFDAGIALVCTSNKDCPASTHCASLVVGGASICIAGL